MRYREGYLHSPLKRYPDHEQPWPADWLEALSACDDAALWRISRGGDTLPGIPALRDFFAETSSLAHVDRFTPPVVVALNKGALGSRISIKKHHEIENLIALVQRLSAKTGEFTAVIDVGGGLGHLARVLNHRTGWPVWVIDSNSSLAGRAEDLVIRSAAAPAPPAAEKLRFCGIKLGPRTEEQVIAHLSEIPSGVLSVGLHTCGALALYHLALSGKLGARAVVNIGCCYTHLHPDNEVNLSAQSAASPLPISPEALLLATSRPCPPGPEALFADLQVSRYRFALHLVYPELLGKNPPTSVGYMKPAAYQKSFGAYAHERLRHLGEIDPPCEQTLDRFYAAPATQRSLQTFLAVTLLRRKLARPLEVYLLLDRLAWLREKWFAQVKLVEVFDPDLSPRNLAILAAQNSF